MKKTKITSVFYHTVSDVELPHIKHLYKIKDRKQFIKDLDFLLKNYEPIDLFQLKKHIYNEQKIPKKSFFLSFDDGLRECYDIIAPILKQKGVPATFFLNSNFIDNKDLFYKFKISLIMEKVKSFDDYYFMKKEYRKMILSISYSNQDLLNKMAEQYEVDFQSFLIKKKPYLTGSQINSLIADGFSIGSHSIDHPEYQHIDMKEQIRQTKISSNFICEKFNLDYKAFAFPFTDYKVTKEFFNTIFNNKFADLTFGTAGLKHDSINRNIQRIAMEEEGKSAEQIIRNQHFKYFIKSFLGKNIIKR